MYRYVDHLEVSASCKADDRSRPRSDIEDDWPLHPRHHKMCSLLVMGFSEASKSAELDRSVSRVDVVHTIVNTVDKSS